MDNAEVKDGNEVKKNEGIPKESLPVPKIFIQQEDSMLLFEELEKKFSAEIVYNRSQESQPSVEVHPDTVFKVISFLKGGPLYVDFLDSITAVDLMNYAGPEVERSVVAWKEVYPTMPVDAKPSDEKKDSPEAEKPKPRFFMVIYHLFSFRFKKRFIIKTILPENKLRVDSVDSLFGNANWLEREVRELLGIEFDKSKDMRNLMLPEGWIGFPLRKDYKEGESFAGMSTQRLDPLVALQEKGAKIKSVLEQ